MICLRFSRREQLRSGMDAGLVLFNTEVSFHNTLIFSDVNPGPGSVDIKGAFDKGSPRIRAYSFGLSREHYKKVFIKENQ